MNDDNEPTPPTAEEIAALLAKQKRPWPTPTSRPTYYWYSTVKVREYWESFYRHLADALESYVLDNPLRQLHRTVARDRTGRRNAAIYEYLGAYDSTGHYEHAGSTVAKALPRVRKLLGDQYLNGVAAGGSSTLLFGWAVMVLRMGDEIGNYPSDHDIQFECSGPADIAGMPDRAAEAIFAMFVRTLGEFVPVAGYVSMAGRNAASNRRFDRDNGYFHTPAEHEPFTAGYHWGLYVPNDDVEILGGRDRFRADAPVDEVVDVEPVDGSPSPGLATRLTTKISSITDERLEEWREFLDPVIDIKPPTEARPRLERPVDVLDRDWSTNPDGPTTNH